MAVLNESYEYYAFYSYNCWSFSEVRSDCVTKKTWNHLAKKIKQKEKYSRFIIAALSVQPTLISTPVDDQGNTLLHVVVSV